MGIFKNVSLANELDSQIANKAQSSLLQIYLDGKPHPLGSITFSICISGLNFKLDRNFVFTVRPKLKDICLVVGSNDQNCVTFTFT